MDRSASLTRPHPPPAGHPAVRPHAVAQRHVGTLAAQGRAQLTEEARVAGAVGIQERHQFAYADPEAVLDGGAVGGEERPERVVGRARAYLAREGA